MIKIIDATLAHLDSYELTEQQIVEFCTDMKNIGITDLEISVKVYETLKKLPDGFLFYMKLGTFDKMCDYPGVSLYILPHEQKEQMVMSEFQVNDVREVVLLRSYKNLAKVRIKGLDDLITHDYSYFFREIKNTFSGNTINLLPENTYNCATAIAVLWLMNGGGEVTTSFAGCGNLAATEEVCMAMRLLERVKPNQKLDALVLLRDWYENIVGEKISTRKPIIGSQIFYVESGIHVDGILKKSSNYEAYAPSIVGQKTNIVIGKYSGKRSIQTKCQEYGIQNDEMIPELLKEVKRVSSEKRKSLSDQEFLELVEKVMADGR